MPRIQQDGGSSVAPSSVTASWRTPRRVSDSVVLSAPKLPQHAVIVGAGPSGLLLAHRLFEDGWRVTLLERRADPRGFEGNLEEQRQWSLGLNVRGRIAMSSVPHLWDAVVPAGVLSEKFFVHLLGPLKLQIRQKVPGSQPSLLINRQSLCRSMLDALCDRNKRDDDADDRLTLLFGAEVVEVSIADAKVRFKVGDGEATWTESADMLVGADGVRSTVRTAMVKHSRGAINATLEELSQRFRVLNQAMPASLDAAAVHVLLPRRKGNKKDADAAARAKRLGGLFIIPATNGRMCGLLSWEGTERPELFDLEAAAAAAALNARFPRLKGAITAEAASRIVGANARDGRAGVVTSTSYVAANGALVALLGDAAHSTGGTLGQGANSALVDALVLADAIRDADGDVLAALKVYDAARVPEGNALAELLGLQNRSARPTRNIFRALLKGVRNRFKRMLNSSDRSTWDAQSLMSQTDTPYVDILQRERGTAET